MIFKIVYAQVFLGMTHLRRFGIGIALTVAAVKLFYFGIQFVLIWLLYLGSLVLGVGSALTFLSVIGYVKYFPPYVVTFYVAGLAFAGFFLGSVYIAALLLEFKFSQVLLCLLPVAAAFVLCFLFLIRQKKKILSNIKSNEGLRVKFMKTLSVQPALNSDDQGDALDIELFFDQIAQKESANDFLTLGNFSGGAAGAE